MIAPGRAIRDAIANRLFELPGYASFSLVRIATIQPDQLPSLTVSLVEETKIPDGDPNAGESRFLSTPSVLVSILRKAGDPVVLQGRADEEADLIENLLLCDPTFVHSVGAFEAPAGETWDFWVSIYWDPNLRRATAEEHGNFLMGFAVRQLRTGLPYWTVSPLFEEVMQVTRATRYPGQGETYFSELMLTFTFRSRVQYPPLVTDDFERMRITTRQLLSDINSPAVTTVIETM
jgi:hypothetical protein